MWISLCWMSCDKYSGELFRQDDPHSFFFQLGDGGRGGLVSDDIMYLVQVADLPKTATVELRAIGQYDNSLGHPDHFLVEARFGKIGDRKSIVEIDAIHAKEEHAAGQLIQYHFGKGAGSRG